MCSLVHQQRNSLERISLDGPLCGIHVEVDVSEPEYSDLVDPTTENVAGSSDMEGSNSSDLVDPTSEKFAGTS